MSNLPITNSPQEEDSEFTPDAIVKPAGETVTNVDYADAYGRRNSLITFIVLFTLCMLVNILMPGRFWNTNYFSYYRDQLAFFCVGGLSAQLAVIAIWCALGPQSFRVRAAVTITLTMLICSSFVIGLQLPDRAQPLNRRMPIGIAIAIFGVGIGSYLLASGVMLLFRWFTRQRIVHQSDPRKVSPEQNYSIRYLIGVTTLVAIVIAVVQGVIPKGGQNGPRANELITMALLATQHAIYSIALLVGCIWLTLRPRINGWGAVWLLLFVLVGAPIDVALMSQYRQFRVNTEVIVLLGWYTVGLVFSTILLLCVVRRLGYRLQRIQE